MSAAERLISGEGVMSFALLRAAGLAAAAVIALPSGGWAQQPYQSQPVFPYTHSIRAEGVPTVYMASDFAGDVDGTVRHALKDIAACNRGEFMGDQPFALY
jgi:hypothetical protein